MRRTGRRQHVGVALFPFLAVLICTMGSLIVLLVLLVQQARLDARSIAAEQVVSAAANKQQLQQQLEEAQWKREMLEQSRAEKAQELADSRAKLAHLESHTQRLAARARELMERAKAIDEGKQLQHDQLAAAQDELKKIQDEIIQKQAELEAARKKLKDQEQWFALIPYEGPHGTRRQPIYIECMEMGVILQPEGILFSTDDFNGPLGPGNPLDSALRTIREHRSAMNRSAGAPYPLLVVRPGGIVAYGAARAALKDWDEEFGYELVGDDKKLVFGSPDPALAAALQKSVAIARRRQAAMAAMMPRRYQDDEPLTSFSPDSIDAATGRPGRPGGSGLGTGAGAGTGRGAAGGLASNVPGGGGMNDTSSGAGPVLSDPRGGGLAAGGQAAGDRIASSRYFGSPGVPGAPGPAGTGTGRGGTGTAGAAGGNTSASGSNGTNFASGPYGPASGSPPSGGVASGNQAGSTAGAPPGPTAAGNVASGGSVAGGGSAVAGSQASTSGQQAAGSSSSSGDPQQGGSPSASFQFGQRGQPAQSAGSASAAAAAAQGRGRDWALPGASRHATAITRPIHVAVLLDRLVLIPDRGTDRVPRHLRISDRMTVEEIDAFVAAVQREMKSWGLAVQNGYWKPVLQVEVAPDAEGHFADLQMALANSGFEVQRKQP